MKACVIRYKLRHLEINHLAGFYPGARSCLKECAKRDLKSFSISKKYRFQKLYLDLEVAFKLYLDLEVAFKLYLDLEV